MRTTYHSLLDLYITHVYCTGMKESLAFWCTDYWRDMHVQHHNGNLLCWRLIELAKEEEWCGDYWTDRDSPPKLK